MVIVRVLMINFCIFIFDEVMLVLDYEFEWVIQDNMVQMSKGRIVFIIVYCFSIVW